MRITQARFAHAAFSIFLNLAFTLTACYAQQPGKSGLTTVNNPGGGQFVYGSLTGQSSKADGMVYMLHLVHGHFGDRPQVGKLIQSHDGSSLAAFFTLNAKNFGGRPVAGLVLVSMPGNSTPQAAVLYDDAKNFVSSEPTMMKSLTAAWGASLGGSSSGAQGQRGTSTNGASPTRQVNMDQFHPTTGGDRSASWT